MEITEILIENFNSWKRVWRSEVIMDIITEMDDFDIIHYQKMLLILKKINNG